VAIGYLNTDLDLISDGDLTPLATELGVRGLMTLHCARMQDNRWLATLESLAQHAEAADTIADLLVAIEGLPPSFTADWRACNVREFNVGYECGRQPRALTQSLPVALLSRLVDVGASLRVTVYPDSIARSADSRRVGVP
jgi:hypothetical protein